MHAFNVISFDIYAIELPVSHSNGPQQFLDGSVNMGIGFNQSL